ncbi:hypothetical protein ACLOJK_039929 [Asimina triloba]
MCIYLQITLYIFLYLTIRIPPCASSQAQATGEVTESRVTIPCLLVHGFLEGRVPRPVIASSHFSISCIGSNARKKTTTFGPLSLHLRPEQSEMHKSPDATRHTVGEEIATPASHMSRDATVHTGGNASVLRPPLEAAHDLHESPDASRRTGGDASIQAPPKDGAAQESGELQIDEVRRTNRYGMLYVMQFSPFLPTQDRTVALLCGRSNRPSDGHWLES